MACEAVVERFGLDDRGRIETRQLRRTHRILPRISKNLNRQRPTTTRRKRQERRTTRFNRTRIPYPPNKRFPASTKTFPTFTIMTRIRRHTPKNSPDTINPLPLVSIPRRNRHTIIPTGTNPRSQHNRDPDRIDTKLRRNTSRRNKIINPQRQLSHRPFPTRNQFNPRYPDLAVIGTTRTRQTKRNIMILLRELLQRTLRSSIRIANQTRWQFLF